MANNNVDSSNQKSFHSPLSILFEIFLFCFLIATVIYIFYTGRNKEHQSELSSWKVQTLDEGWYYYDSNNNKCPISFPATITDNQKGSLTIYGKIPYNTTDKYYLSTRLIYQDARIYINDAIRINCITNSSARPYLKNVLSRYIYIPLKIEDGGKEIRIEFTNAVGEDHSLPEFIYGEKTGIVSFYLKKYILSILLTVFLLVTSLVAIITGLAIRFTTRKKYSLEYIGLALLWISIWSISQTPCRDFFFTDIGAIGIIPPLRL